MDLRAWVAISFGLFLAIVLPVAKGMGLGSITGPVSGAGNQDTGIRERVELIPSRHLLVGRPTHSMIELIVIDASPHPITETQLFVREIAGSNGERSLLLSAPEALRDSVRRVTLYIGGNRDDLVLFERENGTWNCRSVLPVTVSTSGGVAGNDRLLAFPLNGLGFYWVGGIGSRCDGHASHSFPEPTATALLGGDVSRGLLPWGLSGLLLVLIMSLSHWVHAAEKRRDG